MATIDSPERIIFWSRDVIRWLFTWSWQAILVLGVTWTWLKLDRRQTSTTRYRIWLIAMMAVAVLPILTALSRSLRLSITLTPFPVGDAANFSQLAGTPIAAPPGLSWSSVVWPVLFAAWSVGVVLSFYRFGSSLWELHLERVTANPVSLTHLDCSDSDLLGSSNGALSIALIERTNSPGLAGFFRPVILLPADIVSWTSRDERTSILRHELAHIMRRDHVASLFQSVVKSVLFFYPLVRHACNQLSLERELACDDRVLGSGTEPQTYADVILKAVERSFNGDVVHHATLFSSKRMLERRIEMILNANRTRQPHRQWPFIAMPVLLIASCTWLVMPAASSQSVLQPAESRSAQRLSIQPGPEVAAPNQTEVAPSVNRSTILVDSVKQGTLLRQVRGLGSLVASDDGGLKAEIQMPNPQSKEIQVGQAAAIDTRQGLIQGKVIGIDPNRLSGLTLIDVALEGELPQVATAGLAVDGVIEIERLKDVLYVGRPASGRSGEATTSSSLMKADIRRPEFRSNSARAPSTRLKFSAGSSLETK